MARKSSLWLIVLISVVAMGLVASGCAKKQMMREEVAGKPAMEAKKEEAKPQAVEKPKKEASRPPRNGSSHETQRRDHAEGGS